MRGGVGSASSGTRSLQTELTEQKRWMCRGCPAAPGGVRRSVVNSESISPILRDGSRLGCGEHVQKTSDRQPRLQWGPPPWVPSAPLQVCRAAWHLEP